MSHILNGMSVLIKNNIVHRNIKPSHILIKNNKAKIGGFGFSRSVKPNRD